MFLVAAMRKLNLLTKLVTISAFFRGLLGSAFSAFFKDRTFVALCLKEDDGGEDSVSLE